MASLRMILIALAIVAIFVPKTLAKDIIVGDGRGWTLNFDYQAWASGKEFRVGDRLIFKYGQGAHNVMKVDGDGFKQCKNADNALKTGNDIIELKTPGDKWYICGVGQHCENGMKLKITVLSKDGKSSSSAPSAMSISKYWGLMVGVFATIVIFMV